jgi:hypothetical protein
MSDADVKVHNADKQAQNQLPIGKNAVWIGHVKRGSVVIENVVTPKNKTGKGGNATATPTSAYPAVLAKNRQDSYSFKIDAYTTKRMLRNTPVVEYDKYKSSSGKVQ